MMPSKLKKLSTVGLLAVALVAMSGGTANAHWGWGVGWGWGCGWGCDWGCYSTCYQPCYYSCYSPCWSCSDPCCDMVIPVPADAPPATSVSAAVDPTPPPTATTGLLAVSVPADARVEINGHATTTTGTYREYHSENLVPGKTYPYEIRATRVVDGRTVEDRQTVYLRGGETQHLAINFAKRGDAGLVSNW